MQYKMLVLDIDGTLVPKRQKKVTSQTKQVLKQLKRQGVLLTIATGRTYGAIHEEILKELKPDYIICANGAQIYDKSGRILKSHSLTAEEMYALTDFCEDYDHPLCFSYEDGYYAYVGYREILDFYTKYDGHASHIIDGEDQDRHLEGMPFAAFCAMPEEQLAKYQEKYGYLGLRFIPYAPGRYDVARKDMDKAVGLTELLAALKLSAEEIVAMGDNPNDVGMLKLAGLSVCMGDGDPAVLAMADMAAKPSDQEGVAEAVKTIWELSI